MAHRTPKINDTVKFTDQQQAILNDAVEQLMEAGGLTALTQAHFNEAMKIVAQRFINAALQGELKHHLTQEDENLNEEESSAERVENKRNGYSKKTLHGNKGDLEIQVPRDRKGTYVPRLVPKHSRHFNDFDDAIIDLYGRGLSTREISEFIRSQYHVEVSAEFISTVTEKVNDDVRQWQGRPLDSVYPVVFFDALRINIRKDGVIKKMAVHLALGVRCDGRRDVLGMWVHENEGAAFWTSVFTELKNRGVEDILIAVTDGLKGMTQAIEAVFPQAQHQTCIVHLIRASTAFVSHKDRKAVMAGLKPIYQANTPEEALAALEAFENSPMGKRYPHVAQSWRSAWAQVIPFFNFPRSIRKLLYTTNSIEALNRGVRKVIKTRTMFPHEESAKKLIYLALQRIMEKWKLPVRAWSEAMPVFAAMYGERFAAGQP